MSTLEHSGSGKLWQKEVRFIDPCNDNKLRMGDLTGLQQYDAITLLSPASLAQKFLMLKEDVAIRALPFIQQKEYPVPIPIQTDVQKSV